MSVLSGVLLKVLWHPCGNYWQIKEPGSQQIPQQSYHSSCLLHYARERHNEEKTCPLDGDLDSQETRALTVQELFYYA